MKQPCEVVVSIVFGLAVGIGLVLVLNGPGAFAFRRSVQAGGAGLAVNTAESADTTPAFETPPAGSLPTSTPQATSPPDVHADAAPTPIPLEVGARKGPDIEDMLLLRDSTHGTFFDANLCKLALYYGLLCKEIALGTIPLTDEALKDEQGNYFKLIGVNAETLFGDPPSLSREELDVLRTAIEAKGVNLFVSGVKEGLDRTVLSEFTEGAVVGVARPLDTQRDWIVSSAAPEITRVFSGQVVTSTPAAAQGDFALTLGQQNSVTTLISSKDDTGATYPIFVRWQKGAGSVFVDASRPPRSLEEVPLRQMYYDPSSFSTIVPLMLTMRYALGNEAWHNTHNYANLTIDDPALTEPWQALSYTALLQEMQAHNFHTTIAFVPANRDKSRPEVVNLFRAHPDRYSLVQHGNNHDGYEFYKYSVSEDDTYDGQKYPARPLADQKADIVEGLARMAEHSLLTGIPWDRVMVFPYGISPEQTLVSLKANNYLATVNAQDVPLDGTRPSDWDYGMYQANMDYGDFPVLTRRHPGTYSPFRPDLRPFIFDLFLGKPALFYSHAYEGKELFASGIDAFDPVADQVNALPGGVEWRNLGYIIRHLYLEKTNDDGSMDVKMYGNDLIVSNDSGEARTYHLFKEETLNVPIASVTVNGYEFPYRVNGSYLTLDVRMPADSSMKILIKTRAWTKP
ncbi:MAG TPA: hypothetical protein VMW24_27285 [Sedimentisphaerales bacterium]|nr:hypothetical protein [Sedimentisphaerales bacterium]